MLKALSPVVMFTTNPRGLAPLKTILRSATAIVLLLGMAVQGFAGAKNLIAGAGPIKSSSKWAGNSAISVIPGSGLFSVSSSTTVLYIAFTGGTQADISNMVLYTTASRSPSITAVTPVTLNNASNPSLNLTDTSICPSQPVSVTAPCIIRLDPVSLQLLVASDYYFVMYFTNDSNNTQLSVSTPNFATSGLTGWKFPSLDETQLVVGDDLPVQFNSGTPLGLVAVMNK
jgi:hypothetical protein